MPFDERTQRALESLAGPRETFRSAVAQAVEEVRALVSRVRANGSQSDERGRELGGFALDRIDVERFAAVFAHGEALDAASVALIERAQANLEEIAGWSADGFVVHVEPGHDLRGAVAAALAVAGRAFGAARVVELVRSRRYVAAEHADLLGPFPVERWNRAERQIAPPLVVELEGGDLRAGGLSEFMDGAQKLVLVVRGHAPPAPLVRLITPAVLVSQTHDTAELTELVSYDGPAIIALSSNGVARFSHDPRRGESLYARLQIVALPADEPRGVLGVLSAFQRCEELRQLRALVEAATPPEPAASAAGESAAPAAVPNAATAAGAVQPAGDDPAARLAALLLRQADLSDL